MIMERKRMKISLITAALCILLGGSCYAGDRAITMSTAPAQVPLGQTVHFECTGVGEWRSPLRSAQIIIYNLERSGESTVVARQQMTIDGLTASYDFTIPADETAGNWSYTCRLEDRSERERQTASFTVIEPPDDVETKPPPDPGTDPPTDPGTEPPPDVTLVDGPIAAHNTITAYDGPATCVSCHQEEANDMLDSLHMKWSGPTPNLTNTNGEEKGKAVDGINTFCTYAMSSKGACFTCHVRTDGNAPDQPTVDDVDCMMCHNDTYQRKTVTDPNNTETVTNILGQVKTYVFGKVDAEGNYSVEPDYAKMPAGTSMVNLARTVHLPTNKSCLRCHATAGGGDWTKRGDMGLNSATATVDQDVHLAKDGANLTCASCHAAANHKIGGRGIDLRATEAETPTCVSCHSQAPHSNTTLNRHAQGQVSCQTCHIKEFAKGGATEMARDWRTPVWNAAFCSGQGGFVGEEVRQSFVKPEYVWFDGTSNVYNVGDTITADSRGIYPMAKANGAPFDGKSYIVPIKRHGTVMPLHESGRIIPPAIMWMFMTGNFDIAVQKGMEEQGMAGNYTLVEADAEMLISHGVEPKEKAPTCVSCHDGSGTTPDGTKMIPFAALGYHEMPAKVTSCTLCHESKSQSWDTMHQTHRNRSISCSSCHTSAPTGLTKPTSSLCSSCHDSESWSNSSGHKKHIGEGVQCATCHTFT
jgi:hypothetical protein